MDRLPHLHFLIVEDNKAIQMGTRYALEQLDCDVTIASDADAAKKALLPYTTSTLPYHAAALDLGLPNGTDGVTLCRWIRQQYSPTQLPIIIATAADAKDKKSECLDAGAQAFFTKPVMFPVWQQIVEQLRLSIAHHGIAYY